MILNPYDLNFITGEAARSASHLSWSKPLLQDNAVLVLLVLAFLVTDLLAIRIKGVLRYQASWLVDTRSARTFESTAVVYPWIKPLLMIQVFLFFGLSLYCVFDPDYAQHLLHPTVHSWHLMAYATAVLLGWYLWQTILVNWFCYLFGIKEKRSIINRSHTAVFAVLAPVSLLTFILLMTDWFQQKRLLFCLLHSSFYLKLVSFSTELRFFTKVSARYCY